MYPLVNLFASLAGPIRDALKPYWNHPSFVKQRKRIKYLTDRLKKRILPGLTGEYPPSEISSYQGTTGERTGKD
jgi:hypothetical protein